MPTKTLSEVLVAAQTATSLSGLSMLLRNSAGTLATAALTNAVLKSVLTDTVKAGSWFSDANEILQAGVYPCGDNIQNTPNNLGMGILVVFDTGNAIFSTLQIFVSSDSQNLFFRVRWQSWKPWYSLTGTAIS